MKRLLIGLSACLWTLAVHADTVSVAVAANFTQPMQKIAAAFEQSTGHKVILSLGSTGRFYAQIKNGAPFQVFLAADDETPAKLEQEGLGVRGTRFTYAVGQLALWSAQAGLVDPQGQVLKSGAFPKIALADPKLAPYGQAAVQTMSALGLLDALKPHWVTGENIAQTYQFVATGNASLGFVALSQVYANGRFTQGSGWIVPANLYTPIRQDALLLNAGKDKPAAQALMRFLQSDAVRTIVRAHAYKI
jgi:molybdate transport system substrate-binding protein